MISKLFLFSFFIICLNAAIITYQGIPNQDTPEVQWSNGRLFNQTLNNLKNGDTFLIPNNTYFTVKNSILIRK